LLYFVRPKTRAVKIRWQFYRRTRRCSPAKNLNLRCTIGQGEHHEPNEVIWTSSNPDVAVMDASGHLVALKMGSTTITARFHALQASTLVTVTVVSSAAFVVQPASTPVGALIRPAVKVVVKDNLQNGVAGLQVSLNLGPTPPNPARLSGAMTETTDPTGVVTFRNLSLDYLGDGYTLVARVATPTGPFLSTSNPFNETRVGDPCLAPDAPSGSCSDLDQDGLNDAWERAGGVDLNGDGKIDARYDLLLPGADPLRPDVYVKYDYMVAPTTTQLGAPPHSHQPPPAAIAQVVQAFASHGVRLHIDPLHDAIPEVQVTTLDPAPSVACAGPSFVTMQTLRQQYFGNRKWAYHYAVFAHNATTPDNNLDYTHCPFVDGGLPDPTSSGSSQLPGDSAIVAFGYDVDNGIPIGIEAWAGTFMHELGHNFGLRHGSLGNGPSNLPTKPNYISVMGYVYQGGIAVAAQPGSAMPIGCVVDPDCPFGSYCTDDLGGIGGGNVCYRIDYSREKLLDLNEASLNETLGVGGPPGDTDIVFYFASGAAGTLNGPSHGPIDWNNDGNATEANVQSDTDGDNVLTNSNTYTTLFTGNDWEIANGVFVNLDFRAAFADVNDGAGLNSVLASTGTNEPSLRLAWDRHSLYPPANAALALNTSCWNRQFAAPPGIVQVVLLGLAEFDVNQIEPSSLNLHGARPTAIFIEDVNGDGIPDVLLQFRGGDVHLSTNVTGVRLIGWLKNSRRFVAEAKSQCMPAVK
jgi:hypothetical protein